MQGKGELLEAVSRKGKRVLHSCEIRSRDAVCNVVKKGNKRARGNKGQAKTLFLLPSLQVPNQLLDRSNCQQR